MIKLKPLTKEDLPFLLEVRNNESTRKYLENDSVFDLQQCNKWFDDTQPKWYIILNKEEQKVGYLRTNGDEIGCDIHIEHRRKGYARLAYNEYLKDKDYATLWVFEDNFDTFKVSWFFEVLIWDEREVFSELFDSYL